MLRRSGFILSVFVYVAISMAAYPQGCIQRTLSVEDGLAQSQIRWIHEDQKGYLWFATIGGVSRWDGVNFVNYSQEDGLTSNNVCCIQEDKNGGLYFGTNAGVSVLRDGKFITLNEDSGLVNNIVTSLFFGKDGTLYVGTYNGVNIYKDNKFRTLTRDDGLASNCVISIAEGPEGTLYFGTMNKGVSIYKDGLFKNLNTENGLLDNYIGDIYADSDGKVYICTMREICIYENGRLQTLKFIGKTYIAKGQIIQRGKNGLFYFLLQDEVYVFKNGQFKNLHLWREIQERINSIYFTRDGTLYVGTDGLGVKVYRPGRFVTINKKDGLLNHRIAAITGNGRGTVYLGTWGGGVAILHNGHIETLTMENGLKSNYILSIHYSNDGHLYCGTNGWGVSIYKDGKFQVLSFKNDIAKNWIYAICEGHDGTIYFGTNDGLWLYKNGQIEVFYDPLKYVQKHITAIYEGRDGTIFIGTLNGVVTCRNNDFKVLTTKNGLSGNAINCIYEARDRTLYIGTTTGLTVFKDGQFSIIDMNHGLSNNYIYSILEDNAGRIYLATNRGINVLTFFGEQYKIRTLRKTDGLVRDELEINAAYKNCNGRLWFGTTEGASRYDPKFDKPNLTPPQMHITQMRLFDTAVPLLDSLTNRRFPYNENYFQFEYIGIDLSAPEKVIYHYRLSGLDKHWIETKKRYVQYTNLSNGKYTFEVKARNEWGYWSVPARISFEILPPFWQTWWFRIVSLFIICSLIFQLYRYRLKRALEIERLRVKIASDLHDEIGAMLTQLTIFSETIKASKNNVKKIKPAAEKISNLTREILKMFSDIVWAIDARNDRFGNLAARMQDVAHQTLNPKNIESSFRTYGLELTKKLSSNIRQNIYLIYKEAINNIAKHSGASEVKINFMKVNDKLILEIHDNGKTSWKDKKVNGMGLKNMQLRTNQIDGNFRIKHNGGSTITLIVNLK